MNPRTKPLVMHTLLASPRVAAFVGMVLIAACQCGSPIGVPPAGNFRVVPAALDFGRVAVGQRATMPVHIERASRLAVTLDGLGVSGVDAEAFSFTAPVLPLEVPLDKTVDIVVTYSPQRPGPHLARLAIDSSTADAVQLLVPLTGDTLEQVPCFEGICEFPDGGADDAGRVDAGPTLERPDAGRVDAGPTVERPDAGQCSNQAMILASFQRCGSEARVGQSAFAPGVTCNDVCCAFAFSGCAHRATQGDLVACDPSAPSPTGSCSDVYQANWSSQCICSP